jgi:signal transduction histidine kinase
MGSLQFRLFASYIVIIGVTLGLAALSLFLLLGGYRNDITYGNLEDVSLLVNALAATQDEAQPGAEPVPVGDSEALLSTLRNVLSGERNQETSVALVDREGRVLPGYAAPTGVNLEGALVTGADPAAVNPAGDEIEPAKCELEIAGRADLLCVVTPISPAVLEQLPGTDATAIVVAKPAASLGEVFGDLVPRLLFSGLIGVAAALVLGFLLAQSVGAPLRNIARAARNVSRGNYRQRVPATGPREVRDLASNFNRMTEEVQRSQQTLRDFLANISHELKTPLTSIRGFSEAVLDGTIDDSAGIERSAKIINTESNRVLRLVEELLDLSRIESGQVHMRQEDLSLNELLEHVREVFALRSEDTGVVLEMRPQGDAHVKGDFDRLEQVLNNLLDNAFRHTEEGGVVRVASRDLQPGVVQITVSDSGVGIPQEDVPHLFERFYRARKNGATQINGSGGSKGYGLGLAISREIVRAHGGEIWATSELGRGTTFVFTLPTVGKAVKARARR